VVINSDWHRVKVPETVLPIVHLPIILEGIVSVRGRWISHRVFLGSKFLCDWFGWLLKRSEKSDSFCFFLFTRLVWEFDFKNILRKNCWRDFLLMLED
jgi:hypothetical protein